MAGIVLAGGKSRRMGRDKACLPYGDSTLLAHVVEMVRSIAEPTFVVADIADKYVLPDRTVVVGDMFPSAGPLGGLITGLTLAPGTYHVVVACDMPRLNPAVLRLLMEKANGADGAIPEVAGRLEPLCAVYHRRCADALRAQLDAGRLALHMAVESLALRRVGEDALRRIDPDLACFTNLNTPEEYRRVRTDSS